MTIEKQKRIESDYSNYIALSRYARYDDEKNRRETWIETVERLCDFWKSQYPNTFPYARIMDYVVSKKVLPSMRSLMTAGKALELDNAAGYNCAYLPINDPKCFDEVMYLLMCGTGVGFSVERQEVAKLPCIPDELFDTDSVIVVKDSKIGWCTALRELISLLYAGKVPKWDLSKLRPAGARLKTFGGRSSGPAPLNEVFKFIIKTFNKAIGRKLTSIECHDLVCKIAECIVTGGVRRSALISLSNLSDERMRDAKTGQWWEADGQRALANNSVVYTEKPEMSTFMKEWLSLYNSKSGERGIFNRQSAKKYAISSGRRNPNFDFGSNPCLTKDTKILTENGVKQIKDLIGIPFVAVLDGEKYPSTEIGFFSSGVKPVYKITLENHLQVKCTLNHKFLTNDGWKAVEDMTMKDYIVMDKTYNKNKKAQRIVSIKKIENEEVFDCQIPNKNAFSANGLVSHNCGEINLRPFGFCNLSEVVIDQYDTFEDILQKVEIATILGTFQSTLTDFRYLRSIWKKNAEEERLLGVSFTGIMDNRVMSGQEGYDVLANWLQIFKEHAIDVNKKWADLLGISQSVAITTVKPSGTVSQLVNSSSGIHPRYARHYVRTVRSDKKDPLATFLMVQGVPCEDDVMNPNNTYVFSFPMKSPDNCVIANEVDALHQLEMYLVYKKHWTEHNVSITVYVKDHEWMEVGAWVYKNFDDIGGISFLPYSEHIYKQAPYQPISKDEYEKLKNEFININWDQFMEIEDNTTGSQEFACIGGSCELI